MMSTRQTKQQAKLYVILLFALAVISFILAFNSPSQAEKPATFWVTNLRDSGLGSLPQALNDANARPGKDFIKFRVSGTIRISTNLDFADPSGVVLDGFSAPHPGITLSIEGGALAVTSSNNVIRGLAIISSEGGMGIALWNSGGFIVERNLIEGNRITGFGSGVGFNQASKNVIRDNVLVGNHVGVWFNPGAPSNENVFEDNVIGDSIYFGIALNQGFGNIIRGNYIGLDRDGNPLPNGIQGGNQGGGIAIGGDPNSPVPIRRDNTVGPGNVIAFNNGPAIIIHGPSQAAGITFTRNSIFENIGGICLDPPYLLPPEVVTTNPIKGTAPRNSTVEIFFDGGDQGRFFIGSVKADDSGHFASAYTLNGLLQGNVTGTATDKDGNTSMFSPPVSIP